MKKIKRYIAATIFKSIVGVLFVILSLDVLSALIDQLDQLRGGYDFLEAIIYVGLYIPSSTYDFLPLSALVGCLLGLGSLANTSELVVMRSVGVSILQVIWAVTRPVLLIIAGGILLGEYVAPYTDQYADSRRALAQGHESAMRIERGVWNREGNEYMHFNAVLPNGKLYGVTRYIFDEQQNLIEASFVDSAIYQGEGLWIEQDGVVTHFNQDSVQNSGFTFREWRTEVSPNLLNILVLDADELPMQRLYSYSNYLDKQNLDSSEYRLAFWQKALQPLATISLVVIAISFILGPLRQVSMGFRVFVGVLIGLVFQTSQQLLGPVSIIWGFSPMLAVVIPITCCFVIGVALIKRAK